MSVQIDGSTGNIIATKADYSGNVSIGGTLTYEDVTNIDSVGLITARNGIKVDDLGVQVGTGATVDSAAANTLTFLTAGSERLRIDSSGRLLAGTTTEGEANADDLTIATSGHTGITIRSGTANRGNIYFSDGTSGDSEYRGYVEYNHDGDTLKIATANSVRATITSGGKVKIANHGTNDLRTLSVLGPQTQIQFGTAEDVGGFLLSTNNGQFGLAGGGYYNGSNWVAKHTASAQIRTDGDGAIAFFGQSGLTSGNTFTPSERLRITSDGAFGLGGANYGTSGQVIKSNGSGSAPTWQNLYSFMFFGEQDTAHNVATGTYTAIRNLGSRDFGVGDSSIAVFDESNGTLTVGASGAGYWFLSMGVGINDIQVNDYAQCVIGKNGSSTTTGTRISSFGRGWNSTADDQVVVANVSCIANLSANDVVRFMAYHNEGSTENTETNRTFAMGYRLS